MRVHLATVFFFLNKESFIDSTTLYRTQRKRVIAEVIRADFILICPKQQWS
jgi:hypothetical protein